MIAEICKGIDRQLGGFPATQRQESGDDGIAGDIVMQFFTRQFVNGLTIDFDRRKAHQPCQCL